MALELASVSATSARFKSSLAVTGKQKVAVPCSPGCSLMSPPMPLLKSTKSNRPRSPNLNRPRSLGIPPKFLTTKQDQRVYQTITFTKVAFWDGPINYKKIRRKIRVMIEISRLLKILGENGSSCQQKDQLSKVLLLKSGFNKSCAKFSKLKIRNIIRKVI